MSISWFFTDCVSTEEYRAVNTKGPYCININCVHRSSQTTLAS